MSEAVLRLSVLIEDITHDTENRSNGLGLSAEIASPQKYSGYAMSERDGFT